MGVLGFQREDDMLALFGIEDSEEVACKALGNE